MANQTDHEDERNHIEALLQSLDSEPRHVFPELRIEIDAPDKQGVYLIRSETSEVMHVGRTVKGKEALAQGLRNHLHGKSSFVRDYLHGDAKLLRGSFSFQFIVVEDKRERALLEHRAVAWYCPRHLGLG